MTVTAVQMDAQALTLTVSAEFTATPERVWQLWQDPRQLERWWGPPSYPATFTAHDLRVGGQMKYHMTGPTGEMPTGTWEVLEVDPPRHIVFRDADVDEQGVPTDGNGMTSMQVTIRPINDHRTAMDIQARFVDRASLEHHVDLGMEDGFRDAVGQIDAILEEVPVA